MEAKLNDFAMYITKPDNLDGVRLRDAEKRDLLNPISIVYAQDTYIKLSPTGSGEHIDSSKATIKGRDDMQNISVRFSFNDVYMLNCIMKRVL